MSVGDVVVDKLAERNRSEHRAPAADAADYDAVDAAKLDKVSVKAEVVDSPRAPKISIIIQEQVGLPCSARTPSEDRAKITEIA